MRREEKGNERLEKGVLRGKERNSFWGDIWLWLRGAVWTSQALLLVLTGLFRGSWCCLFLNSKWLVNWWVQAMETITRARLDIIEVRVFTYLCIYVKFACTSIVQICGNSMAVWEVVIYTENKFPQECQTFLQCCLFHALMCMRYIC